MSVNKYWEAGYKAGTKAVKEGLPEGYPSSIFDKNVETTIRDLEEILDDLKPDIEEVISSSSGDFFYVLSGAVSNEKTFIAQCQVINRARADYAQSIRALINTIQGISVAE